MLSIVDSNQKVQSEKNCQLSIVYFRYKSSQKLCFRCNYWGALAVLYAFWMRLHDIMDQPLQVRGPT